MKEIYALAANARSITFEGDNFDIFAVVTSLGGETPLYKESDVIGLEIPNFWERMLGKVEVEKESKKCFCGKEHIDLRTTVKYETQYDSKWGNKAKQNTACLKACRLILENAGLHKNSGANSGQFVVSKENRSSTNKKDQDKYIEVDSSVALTAINYIDRQLEARYPVVVGVDHTYNYGYNEGTTDHFIVIIGRGCTENEAYYYFYEVATNTKDNNGEHKGKHDNNKLYVKDDNSLRGTPYYNDEKKYVVTQVRLNVLP